MQILTDQEFTYRQSPTEEDGLAKITDVKGNTLTWNQLIRNGNFADTSKWLAESGATLSISNNIATISSTTVRNGIRQNFSNPFTVGHKYLIKAEFNVPTEYRCVIGTSASQGVQIEKLISTTNTWTEVIGIGTCTASTAIFYCFVSGTTYENVKIRNVMCFDLTQMGLDITEPSEFTSLFPLSYYAYNQGSLLSFNGNGIKTVGKNLVNVDSPNIVNAYINAQGDILTNQQWSTSDYVRVFPNSTYKLSGLTSHPNTNTDNFAFYDGSQTKVGYQSISANDSLTIPNGVVYVRFCWKKTEKDSVMFELGSTATSFEPYTSSTLSLPISTYFPSGMKSAGTVYDELTPNKATTRIGSVDLGSLTWTYHSGSGNMYAEDMSGRKLNSVNAVCSNYQVAKTLVGSVSGVTSDKLVAFQNNLQNRIIIRDTSYTDATVFKQAMADQNVKLYYELATPTETSFTTPQSKDEYPFFKSYKGGTEQILPENGSVPTTAPIICDLMYSSGAIQVTTYPNPEQGGETSGDGWYLVGEEATVNALPNEHYAFNNWVLDGEIVSTDPEYTFEVKDE